MNEVEEDRKKKLHCVIPYSKISGKIKHLLKDTINLITVPGTKIKDCINSTKIKKQSYEDSQIYKIKCSKCPAIYIGETHRRREQRTKEHKADFKYRRQQSAWVKHSEETLHVPDWSSTCTMLKNIRNKSRRILEAAYIKTSEKAINNKGGFFPVISSNRGKYFY